MIFWCWVYSNVSINFLATKYACTSRTAAECRRVLFLLLRLVPDPRPALLLICDLAQTTKGGWLPNPSKAAAQQVHWQETTPRTSRQGNKGRRVQHNNAREATTQHEQACRRSCWVQP